MKKKVYTALGLMTGTSIDGVDLSLIKSDGLTEFSSILNYYYKFDLNLRDKLINLRDKIFTKNDLEKYSDEIGLLEKEITFFHSRIIDEIIKKRNYSIDLIGFHGQTIFHDSGERISRQLGDGKLLSQITRKIVVNNFRKQDLINEGEGAPLTPIFHKLICQKLIKEFNLTYPINIINIGGITNITQIINDDTSNEKFYAYDIGPGNCLIDKWVRQNSKKSFDENGEIAKLGVANELIFNQAVDNFEIKSYEKSLDVNDFDLSFVKGLCLEDGCATLTKFTAYLIANGIKDINKMKNLNPVNNFVCGGGRKNNILIKQINEFLKNMKISLRNIDEFGFDGDFIESQAFGYLSVRSFLNLPNSFPTTTRCNKPTVGGIINKNYI